MPQSLSAVYIHLVFSTKDRRPLLRDKPTRDALHSYLGGVFADELMRVKPNPGTSEPASSAVVVTQTPSERGCGRVALVCSALTVVLGLLTLVAWTTGLHILASGRSKYIPMAPSTALGFLLLGTALFLHITAFARRAARPWSMVSVTLALAFSLLKLLEFFTGIQLGIEEWLVRDPAMFGAVPTARMSPVSPAEELFGKQLPQHGFPEQIHIANATKLSRFTGG